jgi:hypothetical protein
METNVSSGPDHLFPVVIELDNESFEGEAQFNLGIYYAKVFEGLDPVGQRAQQVFSENMHVLSIEEFDLLVRGDTIEVIWSLREPYILIEGQSGVQRRVRVRRK